MPNLNRLPCSEVAYIFFGQTKLMKRTKPHAGAALHHKNCTSWSNFHLKIWVFVNKKDYRNSFKTAKKCNAAYIFV